MPAEEAAVAFIRAGPVGAVGEAGVDWNGGTQGGRGRSMSLVPPRSLAHSMHHRRHRSSEPNAPFSRVADRPVPLAAPLWLFLRTSRKQWLVNVRYERRELACAVPR